MTHARQKGSLSRCHSFGRDQSRGWPRGEAMGRAWPERFLKEAGTKKGVAKKGQSKEPKEAMGERDRKHYPLRGRGGTLEDDVLSSPIQNLEPRGKAVEKRGKEEGKQACRGKSAKKHSNSQPSGSSSKTTSKVQSQGLPPASEPRKRRLASLNAEAVNSLLLEKAEVPPATKVAKKNPQDGPGTGGECSSTTEYAAQDSNTGKSQTCQSPKQQQQQQQQQHPKKPKQTEKDDIDYCKIFAPTPRRLAGLNAAALLKLTSSSAASKQRVKTESKSPCASVVKRVPASTKTLAPSAKKQLKPAGRNAPSPGSGCFSYKKGGFEPSPHWGSTVEDGHMTKVGYQSGSMPEYTLKQVKEEQVEAELSPYCCCGPPNTSLDYCCHRLGLFLRQQPAYSEAEEGPFAAVKQECLVPPPSLAHPSLALSTHHPCLCADHCFSSYYVHMAHARTPPLAALGSRPLTYGPPALCPGPVSGSKLIAPGIAHSSGIPHPPFCTSVRSPCYGESCRVSTYAYRALQPVPTRGCSFSTGCSRCRQEIKTEGYSSPRREHSPSLLQATPAVPLSGCPLPQNTTPAATVPHLLSPLSERRLSEAGVGSGRECPQGSKPSNGSLTARRAKLSLKQQAPMATPSAKQKKVIRRRTTNGWRPIGVPVEKEVFVVGEDEPALRQCFEGVQRDGEEIRVRDTVLLRSGPRKKSLPYVAKISALWEDPKTGEVMMSLFWYYRPEHTQGGKDPNMHCENEIFASKHQDVNSVACIEDKCYVLPLAQYCRYCALIKRQAEGVSEAHPLVPCSADTTTPIPPHRRVPPDVDPKLVYLCRHVYDFRYGRILKNLQ